MEKQILDILKSVLELDVVDETCSQISCAKWDSLKHLELVVEIESEFHVELEPEEIAQMKSFKAIKEILSSK